MRNRASKWFILLALAVGLSSCGTRAVEEAEQRWQASGVTDYRL